MPNLPPDAIDRARALFGDFTMGRWEQAPGNFTTTCAAGWMSSATSLTGGHTQPSPMGAFERG